MNSARWAGRFVGALAENLNRHGVLVAFALVVLAIAVGIAVPIVMRHHADANWSPKDHGDHSGCVGLSTYSVHDYKTAAYVIAYRGGFGSSSSNSFNPKTRVWDENVTLTLKTPAGKKDVSFHRDHTAPEKLTISGKDYNLKQGRVFLVHDDGVVRRLDIQALILENTLAAADLKSKIAALPPEARGDVAPMEDKPRDVKSKTLFEN